MKQWQYRFVYMDFDYKYHINREGIRTALNGEGMAGWECFSIEHEGDIVINDGSQRGREAYRVVLWLKREVAV